MFNILWIFAEFQRNIIVENIKAWIEKAKAKGIKCGRRNTSDKFYNSKLLDEAISLQKQGLSYRKIATALKIKDYSTLSKRVKKYKEKIDNKEIVSNTNIYDFIK
jgi:DNA invertase Pin-like site-specific DNA recombinase